MYSHLPFYRRIPETNQDGSLGLHWYVNVLPQIGSDVGIGSRKVNGVAEVG